MPIAAARLPVYAEIARAIAPKSRPSRTSITSAAASLSPGSAEALAAAPAIAITQTTTAATTHASVTASDFSRISRRRETG